MDVDEDALREGTISPRLHGYLRVPVAPRLVQGGKARTAPGEAAAQAAIAAYVVDALLRPARPCLVGPGTTTGAVLAALGLRKVAARRRRHRGGRLRARPTPTRRRCSRWSRRRAARRCW